MRMMVTLFVLMLCATAGVAGERFDYRFTEGSPQLEHVQSYGAWLMTTTGNMRGMNIGVGYSKPTLGGETVFSLGSGFDANRRSLRGHALIRWAWWSTDRDDFLNRTIWPFRVEAEQRWDLEPGVTNVLTYAMTTATYSRHISNRSIGTEEILKFDTEFHHTTKVFGTWNYGPGAIRVALGLHASHNARLTYDLGYVIQQW